MTPTPPKAFGRRPRTSTLAAKKPVEAAPAPLPPRASNMLKEIALAVVMIAAIGTGFTLHAASLDDALATLGAMTRIEVLAVMAGLMVPWVLLRAICGLPFPEFGTKPTPVTDALADDYDFRERLDAKSAER